MAFHVVANLMGGSVEVAPPKDLQKFKMASGKSGSVGMVCSFDSSGDLDKAGADEKLAAVILMESVGAAKSVRAYWITPGMVFKAPAKSGTMTNVKLGAGLKIGSDGLSVDGATAASADYPLTVVGYDADSKTVLVVFNSCALAPNTTT